MTTIKNRQIEFNSPKGFLINGKISPTVNSGNLTVAITTLAGNDPSPADPVFIRIGDTVRSITSALSITINAGTNRFNAGSSELATKEIDYFVYLGYNATNGVVIVFSRIPYAAIANDFYLAGSTHEKSAAGSSNLASTDEVENIGRFAATLSAGAGYTWSVPTFTASNLVQRPIYETRAMLWTPTTVGWSGTPTSTGRYYIIGKFLHIHEMTIAGTSNATSTSATIPFNSAYLQGASGNGYLTLIQHRDNSTVATTVGKAVIASNDSNLVAFYTTITGGAWTASNLKSIYQTDFILEI